ncbi:MAG: 30S ribosomal protein S8 [Deltaproteobacteria bacterium]|nr:30S ribosomal protein S8 [Deltaproteobacteria bacterium]
MSSVNDPISDFLTRIRNACQAGKEEVSIPASNLKRSLAEILKGEGYIEDVTFVPDRRQGLLVLQLRYGERRKPIIQGLRRESRPGRRIYVSSDELPRVRSGLGTAVISTSRGVMTDRQARRDRLGGEYLCSVW